MNDVVTQEHYTPPAPFGGGGLPAHVNAGTVHVEAKRAAAEVQAAFFIAKSAPRDEIQAFMRMKRACQRLSFAQRAFYSYKRGGENVSGPSIRMAEELARCFGNIDYGLRELSRDDGSSEMQAFCIDLESNVKSSQNFTVKHKRDKRGGATDLTEERDIYEITANMGARRLRARILAILPEDYVQDAIDECRKTMEKGDGKPLSDRIKLMMSAFDDLGVTPAMLEKRLGHKLSETTAAELVELSGVFRAVKDGVSTVDAEFGDREAKTSGSVAAVQAVAKQPQDQAKPKAEPKPKDDPKPEPQREPEPEPKSPPTETKTEAPAPPSAEPEPDAETPAETRTDPEPAGPSERKALF